MSPSENRLESVAIRRGEPADEGSLARIVRAAGDDFRHRQQGIALMLASPDHFIYLAETDEPFGFVGAGQGDGALIGPDAGEIMTLFLLPAYREHGMGKKLLVRGLSVLKRRGFAVAMAWIPAHSLPARATFESLAFERDHSLQREINSGHRTLTEYGYRLDLGDYF